ncbi:phosphoglucosamine mutase [Luteolibacter algae]|uniref:Phosphoglucosamine mutase n=1 Tax=Luteolibacter algae TaxID=454151 RepID=A0ABW5DB59_9BACT
MGKLFGTDGIRGKANEYPVTAAMAEKLGGAVVKVLGDGGDDVTVLIGRDTRESGPILEEGLTRGLISHGAKVVLLGVVPTPAVALLVRQLNATAAVMLTASHNPFEDNGMKIFASDGYKLPDDLEEKIESLLLAEESPGNFSARNIKVDYAEGISDYVNMAKSSVDGLNLGGLKIVLDAGNGAGYQAGPRIFRELGAEVVEMAVTPDGKNINANCGALHAAAAGKLVVEQNAHLGISLDGDADRVIFTTANGEVLSGDRVLALGALSLKKAGKLRHNSMVATVMSNLGMDEALKAEGIDVIRAGVGDRLVLEEMRASDLCFGGENSGHLIFSDFATTGDGIMSALQVCKMMVDSGKTLEELASVMNEYPSELLNLSVGSKPPLESLTKLQNLIKEAEQEFQNSGRQLIRYSGTENKIRVLVEHKEAATVERWIGKFKEVIAEELG